MKKYFLCCISLLVFSLLGCTLQEESVEKIDVEKVILSRRPAYAFKSEYVFSKYEKNAVINGENIWGTGLWEELSFAKKRRTFKII